MPEEEITLKNTKSEILDALNRALKRAELAEKGRLNPEKEEKEISEKRAVKSAKEAVEQRIFSKELNDKFNDLQTAIDTEERRLQELYGIGREIQKLALVIEAGREKIAAIEAEKLKNDEAAKESLKKLNAEFEQRNAALQSEYDTYSKKLKTERVRESEEYQYNLARTREKENNSWADEKRARELELQGREARASELLADAESKVDYIRSLEEKAGSFPKLLESERKAAISATTEELKKEYDHQKALSEMEYKSAIARLDDRAAFLEKQLADSKKALETQQTKLDKAYSEIRDLATKTVESAGSIKIIGNAEKNNG